MNLRTEATLSAKSLRQLRSGEVIRVLEGPVDADGYYWWKIETSDGLSGWSVEMYAWYLWQQQPNSSHNYVSIVNYPDGEIYPIGEVGFEGWVILP